MLMPEASMFAAEPRCTNGGRAIRSRSFGTGSPAPAETYNTLMLHMSLRLRWIPFVAITSTHADRRDTKLWKPTQWHEFTRWLFPQRLSFDVAADCCLPTAPSCKRPCCRPRPILYTQRPRAPSWLRFRKSPLQRPTRIRGFQKVLRIDSEVIAPHKIACRVTNVGICRRRAPRSGAIRAL